jgi:hypothetical protein
MALAAYCVEAAAPVHALPAKSRRKSLPCGWQEFFSENRKIDLSRFGVLPYDPAPSGPERSGWLFWAWGRFDEAGV